MEGIVAVAVAFGLWIGGAAIGHSVASKSVREAFERAVAQSCADTGRFELTLDDARYRVRCSRPETLVEPWGE